MNKTEFDEKMKNMLHGELIIVKWYAMIFHRKAK